MEILNLTQHQATSEQVEQGVINLEDSSDLKNLLTFNTLPSQDELIQSAMAITKIALDYGAKKVMIGGAL